MNFRTTSFSLSRQALEYSNRYNASLYRHQRDISSGVRLHKTSDDPLAFRQATSMAARLKNLNTEESAIQGATAKLDTSVSQLTDASNFLNRARVAAQQGVQALDDASRNALALEVEGVLESLKNVSRTKAGGSHLYSGSRTNVAPFEFSDPVVDGGTLNVNYLGAELNSRAFISSTVAVDTLYSGASVFGAQDRGATILFGQTGAEVGSGTDSLIGRATLQVRHVSTTYQGASGVAAGTSSAGGDSIIGAVGTHTLTIDDTSGDGSSGTVSLNGGTPVAYTSADTDLQIKGPDGSTVYLDTSSIAAGFSGTVDIVAEGTLSVDGGLTTIPIDFTDNQQVVDSTTDRHANIRSTKITSTGDNYLEFPGTSDAFQVLYDLAQDLRNTRELSSLDYAEALDRRMGELTRLSDHMLGTVGEQSVSLQTLDRLQDRNQDLQLHTETQLSEIQATDIPTAILEMENTQTLLEYTYAVTAQINALTLLDFL